MGLVPARDDDSIDQISLLLRRVDELERLGASRWGAPAGPWHNVGGVGEPAFQNSWSNFAAGFQVARFRLCGGGTQVEVQGMVKTGTLGTAVFTLPAGYRPALQIRFAQNLFLSTSGEPDPSRIDVLANGNVTVTATAGVGTASNTSINFTFGLG